MNDLGKQTCLYTCPVRSLYSHFDKSVGLTIAYGGLLDMAFIYTEPTCEANYIQGKLCTNCIPLGKHSYPPHEHTCSGLHPQLARGSF